MRPARVLNLFISSILPSHDSLAFKLQQKSLPTCFGCGRFQSRWKLLRFYSIQPSTVYTKIRPAEPCISIIKTAKQGRPSDALSTYLKLIEQGMIPSREALYQLAHSLYKNNHLVGMRALHDTLVQFHNICPLSDRRHRSLTYVYTMFINLIARTTNDMQSIEKICQLMSHAMRQGNVVIYNTMINIFLENKDKENAIKVYEELKQQCSPTLITFSILMKDAEERKDYKAMIYYLDEMKTYSISPDRSMVHVVVSLLCQISQFELAKRFVEELHAEAKKLVPKKLKKKLLIKITNHRKKTNKHRKLYSVNKKTSKL